MEPFEPPPPPPPKSATDALVGFGQATGEYIGNGKGEQNNQNLSLPDSEENGMEIEPPEEHLYDFDDDLDTDQNINRIKQ